MRMNLLAGWIGIVAGIVAGAVPGLYFWREEWLGGYASWRRRMVRLGHVSFFGLGFINILFALTVAALSLPMSGALDWSSRFFVAGAIAMPLVCYLAAWKIGLRQLFPIPVGFVISGVLLLVWMLL